MCAGQRRCRPAKGGFDQGICESVMRKDDCAKTASSNGTVPFQDIANSWSYRMRGHELRTQTNANHTTPAMAVLHSNAHSQQQRARNLVQLCRNAAQASLYVQAAQAANSKQGSK